MSKILESKVYEIEDDSSEEEQGPGEESDQYQSDSNAGFQMVEDSDNVQPGQDQQAGELSEKSEESGDEDSDNDAPIPVPESLKRIFSQEKAMADYTKTAQDIQNKSSSLFTKVSKKQDTTTTTLNLTNSKLEKAQKIYDNLSIFNGVSADSKQIKPLFSKKLDAKQARREQEATTGKNWGYMEKVELTEEIKADLRAIKLRNQIFKDRFYKSSDSKKLPEYFQIGTVVDDPRAEGGNSGRLTKKQRKSTIAQQFLGDDDTSGFSKRKYESLNDRKRRMGDKKKNIKINKKLGRTSGGIKGKKISKA